MTYLQALRLEKAKHLLETTKLSLESITARVGYEDEQLVSPLVPATSRLLAGGISQDVRAAGVLPLIP